ncbi:hypothetical protein TeGR_g13145 [Tetraparma gracilis]|uniref:Uncharacterized protein n=1 Tax=Tetraparma gracilis TaxID=2962635 RepID=A0ABQ6MEF9_9STRA|nr:hypothetical protein TeGR_g13145 [Tetraparma gracilis]
MPPTSTYGIAGQQGDIPRPRRPDPKDLSYLQSLPLQQPSNRAPVDEASDEVERERASASVLAARNALSSLRGSLASLAGEERGSSLVELCISRALSADPCVQAGDAAAEEGERGDVQAALAELVGALRPYAHFLAINRYGSHVLQALLSRLPPLVPLMPPGNLPPLLELLKDLAGPFPDLIPHISGSHICRSLLCVLRGLPPAALADRRGKKSKHSHTGSATDKPSGASWRA